MGGVWNVVKAGATVPLMFEAFAGSKELTDTSVVVQPLTATQSACSGGAEDNIELPLIGDTSVHYLLGRFVYLWKTPRTPKACYVVTVQLTDGSSISAKFKLR
jgi:hypothetical protein